MAERKIFARFVAVAAVSALQVLMTMCALPHERYLRFQSLTELAVVKAGWIYERTHFDPSPIDIVFIGTSHTVMGVDSDLVERACREKGTSRCATVNFALEHLGRNVQWLIAREVIEA